MPLGTMLPIDAKTPPPEGYEVCDGRRLAVSEHEELHALLLPVADMWRGWLGADIDDEFITLPSPNKRDVQVGTLGAEIENSPISHLIIRARYSNVNSDGITSKMDRHDPTER